MKKYDAFLMIASSFLLPSGAVAAQQAGPPAAAASKADPAIWVVRDQDTTIYLFGTFHITDARRDWFDDKVKDAFDNSRELVIEADVPADPKEALLRLQPLIERYAVDPQGRTISSQLTAEQNRVLNEALGLIGIAEGSYDQMEPWFINMTLTRALGQRIGASIENGAEAVLRRAAGKTKSVVALETAEDQFQLFDGLPEQGQLAQLKAMLDNWAAIGTQLPRLLHIWRRGDTETLDRVLNASFRSDPQFRRKLLDDRNKAWADWIARRLERPGAVFLAVGAGHLVGPESVQAFLQQRGIQSARLQGEEAFRKYPPCRSRSDDRCIQAR